MSYIKDTLKHGTMKSKILLLLAAFVVFWTPVVIFSKIAAEVMDRQPIGIDYNILHAVHSFASPVLDRFFIFITNLGSAEFIIIATLMILAYLLYKHQRQNALILAASVSGAAITNFVLKALVHRTRPSLWHQVITETGYSFPSGHAMLSSALILSVVFIIWKTRFRWVGVIIGAILIGLIGLSRVYLGVHFPTDIVAGWSVSFVWVFIVLVVTKSLSIELRRLKTN
jgi:undecaprenyl-diphosphatase